MTQNEDRESALSRGRAQAKEMRQLNQEWSADRQPLMEQKSAEVIAKYPELIGDADRAVHLLCPKREAGGEFHVLDDYRYGLRMTEDGEIRIGVASDGEIEERPQEVAQYHAPDFPTPVGEHPPIRDAEPGLGSSYADETALRLQFKCAFPGCTYDGRRRQEKVIDLIVTAMTQGVSAIPIERPSTS